jgi:hypothetical protein
LASIGFALRFLSFGDYAQGGRKIDRELGGEGRRFRKSYSYCTQSVPPKVEGAGNAGRSTAPAALRGTTAGKSAFGLLETKSP